MVSNFQQYVDRARYPGRSDEYQVLRSSYGQYTNFAFVAATVTVIESIGLALLRMTISNTSTPPGWRVIKLD
jgi:hypothetical protein